MAIRWLLCVLVFVVFFFSSFKQNTSEASISWKNSIFFSEHNAWVQTADGFVSTTNEQQQQKNTEKIVTQFVIFVFNYAGVLGSVAYGIVKMFNEKDSHSEWERHMQRVESILCLLTIIEFNAMFHSNSIWQARTAKTSSIIGKSASDGKQRAHKLNGEKNRRKYTSMRE